MFVLQTAINCVRLLSDTSCTRWLQVPPRLYGHRTRKPTGDRNTGQTKYLKNTFGGMSKQVNIALCVSASQQDTLLLLNIQDMNFRGCLLLNRYTLSKNTWNPNPTTSAQFTRQNCNLRTLPHLLLKCVISTHISRQAIQPHLSVSASTIREMTLHSGLSTFLIWTATFPPIQLTVFIYLNW